MTTNYLNTGAELLAEAPSSLYQLSLRHWAMSIIILASESSIVTNLYMMKAKITIIIMFNLLSVSCECFLHNTNL
jgi:hypothetical protein